MAVLPEIVEEGAANFAGRTHRVLITSITLPAGASYRVRSGRKTPEKKR
jgi:hypothetical protein